MSPLYHDSIPNAPGIYRITCIANSRFYIGSTINLRKRWREHRNSLSCDEHCNQHLQRAWNKHGKDAFIFDVVELVLLPDMLTAREQHWLDTLKPFNEKGFNIDRIAGSRQGWEPTAETIEKLRLANLGKSQSEETKQKISQTAKGKIHSPETREKLRTALLGHPVSLETRERLRSIQLGKSQSPESIEKTRQALIGRPVSPETRAKIGAANKGRKANPELQAVRMKTLIVIAPDGTEQIIHGIGKFCREHNLNHSNLILVAKGKISQHKGWKARFPE